MIDTADTLRKAAQAYYNGEESPLTDEQYDSLVERLRKEDPTNPFLSEVGAKVNGQKTTEHTVPMLSLDKATTQGELEKWVDAGDDGYVVTPKLDGTSLSLVYSNGVLVAATTRGDGKTGQDVLANVRLIPSVRQSVSDRRDLIVRGEVVLTFANFEKVGGSNPRNVGNGILLRSSEKDKQYLSFYAYDVIGTDLPTYSAKLDALHDLSFNTPSTIVAYSKSDLIAAVETVGQERSSLPYPTDGAVIRLNSEKEAKRAGSGNRTPKYAIAYKWEGESATTKVIGKTITVGHTGAIIPALQLEPVELNGTTVSNVLVNNFSYIAGLDVAIGDTVLMIKGGEIIPYIKEVVERPADREVIEEPATCPSCGHHTYHKETGNGPSAVTYCSNHTGCKAQTIGKINRWVTSLSILGVGDSVQEALYNSGVREVADLYTLEASTLSNLPIGNGTLGRNAEKIMEEINTKGTNLSLPQFLGSLGIEGLGKRRVELISKRWGLDTLEDWLDKVGHIDLPSANPWKEYLKENREQVLELSRIVGVGAEVKAVPASEGTLVFVLTGKFEVPKAEIHKMIEQKGHRFADSIRKGETTHLVQSDPNSTSSKSKKAKSLGIEVIGLEQLNQLLS